MQQQYKQREKNTLIIRIYVESQLSINAQVHLMNNEKLGSLKPKTGIANDFN